MEKGIQLVTKDDLSDFASKKGMWHLDAEVFGEWYADSGLSLWPSYVEEWIDRFKKGNALSKMDLSRLRKYKEAVNVVLSQH